MVYFGECPSTILEFLGSETVGVSELVGSFTL